MTLRGGQGGLVVGNSVTSGGVMPIARGIAVLTGTGVVNDNYVSNCVNGFKFEGTAVKYRDNSTTGCTTPFTGGTVVGTNND
jgi:hypothetical protein